jgi:hypothetical protein
MDTDTRATDATLRPFAGRDERTCEMCAATVDHEVRYCHDRHRAGPLRFDRVFGSDPPDEYSASARPHLHRRCPHCGYVSLTHTKAAESPVPEVVHLGDSIWVIGEDGRQILGRVTDLDRTSYPMTIRVRDVSTPEEDR